MPVHFSRLRIAGFKSFAEPISVEILPGLTGIVGPNGCGKSNVVEALRWSMGESSAKNMRGGEMDDVIFAGTGSRSSRNLAEVTLTLKEATGLAPPPFHEVAELEISRRISRGSGSAYRINGREARARDVQTLFADLASGARSSAMVSQGRVGSIVNARPDERRTVLEEAAGITGLHARRHEAELKLRAAEANIARAEDLRGQLDSQLGALKRQARQASRFRNISGAVRQAEQEFLSILRAGVDVAQAAARKTLHEAGIAVAEATSAATALNAEAIEHEARLPPLRAHEAEARTVLERHRLAQEQVAAEETRVRTALTEAESRREQLGRDHGHATRLAHDAAAAEQRLAAESLALDAAIVGHEDRIRAAETAVAVAADAVRLAEAASNRAIEAAAEATARAQSVTEALVQAEQRARKLSDELRKVNEERGRIAAQVVELARVDTARRELSQAEAAMTATRIELDGAEQARVATQAALASARGEESSTGSAAARLVAETTALRQVLGVKDNERWPPLLDALSVPPGLETALGAALGEELSSAADQQAARHWRDMPALDPAPSLPPGATALFGVVRFPDTLSRALSQIGLVEDEAAAAELQPDLAPGQTLVSRAGGVWRWDGYTIRAGTPTAATVRLQQRNRLALLSADLAVVREAAEAARAVRARADAAAIAAVASEQQARATKRDAEQRMERARAAHENLDRAAATGAARLAAIEQQLSRLVPECAEADATLAGARAAGSSLPDIAALRGMVEQARAGQSACRRDEAVARGACENLAREHAVSGQRLTAIARERGDWINRSRDAAARVTDIVARQAEAVAEHATLAAGPAAIAGRRAKALDRLQGAEQAHRISASALSAAIGHAQDAARASRVAEARLATARENLVRSEGHAEQADRSWGVVAERILERLGTDASLPDPPAELTPEAEEKAKKKLERLQREREEMGPVNLRADIEAAEIETQLATIAAECHELASAIAKLRGSIGHLNREGRERLAAVFQQVDRHFQALFSRMFGGGRAHLAMVGSDDPLEAGLEIYAQPPGKKLAVLSLLSGGEQALTALSLIFAVFLCNPAPICVLDEVDAPLDDANVERFCALLEDMVRETSTRFLVVTHHPLTMARMDRLYGVTMQERGVSRLLSVDLQLAEAMVEPSRLAAE